ncbi:hypothetical protein [Candidatus Poriferisodalis sp.]|uniref:hypothetical protein n=1 Tax=Candidatus Poriferisodalis sp. TaxID=3101277 RepID=UPI003B515B68
MTRRYQTYCDSGCEWLGDLPSHWRTTPLHRLVSYRTSSVDKKSKADEIPVRLCNYTDVYYSERIRAADGEYMAATATGHEVERFGLRPGDVIITKDSEDWRDIGVPALVEDSSDDFVCGYHLGIVRAGAEIDSGYLFRALLSDGVNKQLQVAATGVTRYGIPNASVESAVLPLPPLDEQRAIAAHLDRDTARIDRLITLQESLIERLDEYRTALVTRVVTKGLPPEAAEAAGLDPEPALKDSRVEWLGEVPEHWEVHRLKHVASYRTSNVDKTSIDGELPVRLCNYTDVYYRGVIRSSDGDFMRATATPREIARFRLQPGDVLITKDSEDWRDIGVPALVVESADDFVCGYHLGIIKSTRHLDSRFVYRAVQSEAVNRQLQVSASGVTRYGLLNASVEDVVLAVPPHDEQEVIAAYLDSQSHRIDVLREKAELSIERLREYRSALLSAAVTGKVDVRDVAASDAGGGGVSAS